MSRDFGLLDLWRAVAAAVPERECLVQGERRLTWAQVDERSDRLAGWLTAQGFGARARPAADWESPNDLVGLLMRNSVEYLEASIACLKARCAPFNVNYRYRTAELAELLSDARPSAVIHGREFGPGLVGAIDVAGSTRPALVHVQDDSGVAPPAGAVAYEDAVAGPPVPATVVSSPDDVQILYTGGTTGRPKGVLWRQRELAGRPTGITLGSPAEAAEGAPRRGWLRAHPAPPLMHGAAAWFSYGAWARGATIVLGEQRSFDPVATLALCRSERVTWMAIVGDAFGRGLVEALDAGAPAPETVSYIFSSGAALSDAVWQGLERHFPGLRLYNAFGSSETGPQAVRSAPGETGFAPGPDTTVVSEDFATLLDAAHPGTGWLSNGGDLPRGYLGDRERTQATFRTVQGRRLAVSGDRARVDPDGTLTFLGRESGVINSAGEKIYAEEVEAALRELDGVDDALVFGTPSERWGSEVVALLVPGSTGEVDRAALRRATDDRLAAYKFPKVIEWVPEIRRHDNGKPDYEWARECVGAEGGT